MRELLTCEVEGDRLWSGEVSAHDPELGIAGLKNLLLKPHNLTPMAFLSQFVCGPN